MSGEWTCRWRRYGTWSLRHRATHYGLLCGRVAPESGVDGVTEIQFSRRGMTCLDCTRIERYLAYVRTPRWRVLLRRRRRKRWLRAAHWHLLTDPTDGRAR